MSTPEAYRDQLVALQPKGRALPRETDKNWLRLLAGIGVEFSRVHGRINDLRGEITLTDTVELLSDWEAALALPNKCAPAPTSHTQRLERILAKLAEQGGQSVAYFTAVAARYGIAITIDEDSEPFEVGVHGMGDPVGGDEWRYVWYAHVDPAPPVSVRQLLQCVFKSIVPADRILHWRWGDEPVCIGPFYYDGTMSHDGSIDHSGGTCEPLQALYDGTFTHNGAISYGG